MGIFVGIGIQTGGLEDQKCNMPVGSDATAAGGR